MGEEALKPTFIPRWLFDTTSTVGHVWVIHTHAPGFVGELLAADQLGAEELDLPIIPIDANRAVVVRSFVSDLQLAVGDIEASLHDAVEMFEARSR